MKLRLAPDAQQVLVAAVADARQKKHAEVTREHVLAALVDVEELWPTLLPIRFYRREVAALVAARLARLPETGGYRDANVVVPLSSPLRTILEEQRRGILFTRVITASDLLDALMDDPQIAQIVAEARLDLDVFESTLEAAFAIALERRHITLRHEHVLRVLVEERWLARAIHAAGGDVDLLRHQLDTTLDTFVTRQKKHGEIGATKALTVLVQRARAYGNKHLGHATSDLFLIFALQDPDTRATFTAARIDPAELLSTLVHGTAVERDEDGKEVGALEVVFHNDNFTTQELVVHMLMQVFGLDRERAVATMLVVHFKGEAAIGVYPSPEARKRAREATALARDAGFPLRVTTRSVPGHLPTTITDH